MTQTQHIANTLARRTHTAHGQVTRRIAAARYARAADLADNLGNKATRDLYLRKAEKQLEEK